MTINTTISDVKYNGNGVTTSFAITFPFLSSSDIKVILTDSSSNDTNLTSPTHYSIDSSNNVIMVTPPASGEKLTIYRDTGITQNVDYIEGDSFPAQTHETALDRLTMISQEIADDLTGALKLKKSSSSTVDLTLPDPVANKTLAWNATADAIENGLSFTDITQAVTDAQIAQAAAEAAQAGAELILDTFDDRYLGEKAADPTVDNDGNPLQVGAEYWNNVVNERRTWTGTAWIASGASTASGIINVPSGNISSTDVQSAINELDTEKVGTSDIGVTVQSYDADLDTVASVGVGTGNNQIVQLDASAKLPAVDGSQLTGISEGLGDGQTWQSVTRSLGVSYTNSTGRSIMVSISIGATTVGGYYGVTVGGVVLHQTSIYSHGQAYSFVVPDGQAYYVSNISGVALSYWKELR